jgi:hypothetical protein
MARKDDNFAPVTRGVSLANEFVRGDLKALQDLRVGSGLNLHILRLLKLHPHLKVRFRN